mmetsp:Transcript_42262/g.72780  ORF Transcript_42262/g.72780 Transcript_42262/m.72780 type:complete len:233 (-) Transcript_42262:164-862(-)
MLPVRVAGQQALRKLASINRVTQRSCTWINPSLSNEVSTVGPKKYVVAPVALPMLIALAAPVLAFAENAVEAPKTEINNENEEEGVPSLDVAEGQEEETIGAMLMRDDSIDEEDEETNCSFCIYMRSGPCGKYFRKWEKCLKICKERDISFVEQCKEPTTYMYTCMNEYPDYYKPVLESKGDGEPTEEDEPSSNKDKPSANDTDTEVDASNFTDAGKGQEEKRGVGANGNSS